MLTDFRLQVFDVVARELSFTKAAAQLNISQPAVTKHIRELERLIGEPLFVRSGNRISLAPRGEALRPLVRDLLESYDRLNESVSASRNLYEGRLRIGVSTTIMQYILPEILAHFRKKYPAVSVVLSSGNSQEVLSELERGAIELALVEDAHQLSTFHYEEFASDQIVLTTAHGTKRELEVNGLVALPLVLREDGSGTLDVVEKELAAHEIHRRILNVEMQIGSSEAIIRYLKLSKCYAFLSLSAVQEYVDRGELRIVKVKGLNIERSLRFASLHGHMPHLVELFKNFCRELSL